MQAQRRAEFEAFVAMRAPHYLRVATALSGDANTGEDLLQSALEALLRRWGHAEVIQDSDAYLRRILVNKVIDAARVRGRERKLITAKASQMPATADRSETLAGDLWVLEVLGRLPAPQRAVVVLRVVEDLSIQQTAACLNMAPGTVKSHLSRALATLRTTLTLSGEH